MGNLLTFEEDVTQLWYFQAEMNEETNIFFTIIISF